MSGPTTVGSIDAKLTVDDSDFKRGMTEAKAEAKEVGALNPDVKVDANVGPALAKLDAVTSAEKRLEAAQRAKLNTSGALSLAEMRYESVLSKTGATDLQVAAAEEALARARRADMAATEKSAAATAALNAVKSEDAHKSEEQAVANDKNTESTKRATQANRQNVSALGVAVALAPAILAAAAPIGGAAVGLGAAFGAMGVAGVLAFKGIKDAMQVGDTVGNTYATGLGVLKGDLDKLAATSANGMLSGFSSAVGDINSRMPFLNQMAGQFSGMLGQIGGTALRGVLDGLQQMNPLIQAGGIELSKFVAWLTSFTSTNGFQQFVQYSIDNLPSVMHLIESLVTLAGKVLAAFAPIGPVVITVLSAISDGLSSLPLPILAGLVTTLTTIAPALRIAGAAMATFGIEANLAVPVVGILTAALAGIGMAVATAASSTDQGTASVQDYTQALKDDNEALGEHVRMQAIKALSDAGAFDSARELGIAQKTLTDAVMGNKDAIDQVNAAVQRGRAFQNDWSQGVVDANTGIYIATDAQNKMGGAIDKVTGQIGQQTGAIARSKQVNEDAAAANGQTTGSLTAQTQAAQAQADQYGVTVGMYQAAKTAQDQAATSTAQHTLDMQLQNDAAGLLKQAFDVLNGKVLNVEQANTRAASASNSATKSFEQNGLAITGTTDAAIANQQALQNKVTADQAASDAITKSTGSTEKGTAAYAASKKALEDQLKAQGLLTPAIQDYIDKLYGIPASAKTQVELDKAKADAALALWKQEVEDATRRRTQYIDVITNRIDKSTQDPAGSGSSIGGRADGKLTGGAATGGLIHPGFSASSPAYLSEGGSPFVPRGTDTIPAMLTPGEIVMKRASVASLGAGNLLYANRTGQWPDQGGKGSQPVTVNLILDGQIIDTRIVDIANSAARGAISAANSDAGRRPAR